MLTNGRARYTFTSRGGGLKLVELLDYPETISARWTRTKAASDAVASLNTGAAVPVMALLGDTNLTGDGEFALIEDGRRRARGKTAAGRPVADQGISFKLELSGQRQRESEKHVGPAARAAGAGMGRGHGDADGRGRQLFFHLRRRHVVRRHEERDGPALLFQPQHDHFGFLSPDAQNRILGGRKQCRLGIGGKPIFHAAGHAEAAGGANRRAAGDAAGVFERGAGAGHAAAAGRRDGAGLSGADAGGKFQHRAAIRHLRRAEGIPDAGGHRRGISKPRGRRDGFWRIFRILREAAAADHELAARRHAAWLRLGDCFDHRSCCAAFSGR